MLGGGKIKRSWRARHFVGIVFALLIIVITVQNIKTVDFDLFSWQINISLTILLALAMSLGFIIGVIMMKTKERRTVFSTSNQKRPFGKNPKGRSKWRIFNRFGKRW